MPDLLPKFDAPPVVETVLSIQFDRIPGFTGAHAGWFWKLYLSGPFGEWPKVNETARLDDQFERFGEQRTWSIPGLHFGPVESQRLQFIRADDERMVQVQDSRLALNWRRVEGTYPSYGVLFPEFMALLNAFSHFAGEANLGELKFNQWEVTYVNHLFRGELWNSPEDIAQIFKSIHLPPVVESVATGESIGGNWKYVLGDDSGRMHVALSHVKVAPDNREALRLQFVTRGPLTAEGPAVTECFDLGHEAIVRSFALLTSESAQRSWKRTQ